MCFSPEMSATFSCMGLAFAYWCHSTNGNRYITQGVLYFVLMELLQVVQYQFIATDIDPHNPTREDMLNSPQCQDKTNRFLTVLGLLHIAYQPLFSGYLANAFCSRPENVAQFKLVQRLQILGGIWFVSRYFFTWFSADDLKAFGIDERYGYDPKAPWNADGSVVEWLNGPELCTYKGIHHLAWSIPMAPISYYMPSMSVHCLLMFSPFFLIDHGSFSKNIGIRVAGFVLFATGPVLADYITPNKHEAASIWCFFSICQVVGLVCILVGQKMSMGKWNVKKGNQKKQKKR